MNYEETLNAMDLIIANMKKRGITPASLDSAIDDVERLAENNPDYFQHMARAFEEDRAKPLSRLQLAQRHYLTNVELLRGVANDAYPAVSPSDVDALMDKLHHHLPTYRGSANESDFLAWSIRYLRHETDVLHRFDDFYIRHRGVVLEGIWSVLRAATDLMDDATVDELEAEVWSWLYEDRASPLYTEGECAKATTRLCGRAYWFARAWKTARLRERNRFKPIEQIAERPYPQSARKPPADEAAARMSHVDNTL